MYFCVQCAPCALISPIASPLCCSILSPTSFASSVHSLYCISLLTLNRPGWYLNFTAWFMWSMWELYEQKKVKLWSKWHFVEIKTDYASLCNNSDFHLNLGIFYMPQIYDMGPTAFLPLQRKACWGSFFALKIRRLRPGLNPRTWALKASTLPLDHRSRCVLGTREKFKVCSLLLYLSNSMQQSPWEIDSSSSSQESPRTLRSQIFFTMFTRAQNFTLSWTWLIHSFRNHLIS